MRRTFLDFCQIKTRERVVSHIFFRGVGDSFISFRKINQNIFLKEDKNGVGEWINFIPLIFQLIFKQQIKFLLSKEIF